MVKAVNYQRNSGHIHKLRKHVLMTIFKSISLLHFFFIRR